LFLIKRPVSYQIAPLAVDDQVINIDPNGFTIPINPTIHTTNENFFDIGLHISVQGTHPAYAGGMVPLGSGRLEDATLYRRSEQDISFPFLVQYNNTFDPDFAYFSQVLDNCTDISNMQLYMDVGMLLNYHTWIKSGTMDESRNVYIPCPISSDEAQRIKTFLPFLSQEGSTIPSS